MPGGGNTNTHQTQTNIRIDGNLAYSAVFWAIAMCACPYTYLQTQVVSQVWDFFSPRKDPRQQNAQYFLASNLKTQMGSTLCEQNWLIPYSTSSQDVAIYYDTYMDINEARSNQIRSRHFNLITGQGWACGRVASLLPEDSSPNINVLAAAFPIP